MMPRFTLPLAAAFALAAWAIPGSARALDPAPWDAVLQAHARRGGVDYAALKVDAAAMEKLDAFLAEVATMPQSAPLADWLNAYNALVVKSVVERHPLRSVKDVPGFFDGQRHAVAGAQRTLDDVENRIIRPRFADPRVHFALNCGARSCPALHGRAFREGGLDGTLDRLVRRALRSRTHVRHEDDGSWAVSSIFTWFRDDFVKAAGSVTAWLARYGVEGIAGVDDAALGQIPYDWRLNDRG